MRHHADEERAVALSRAGVRTTRLYTEDSRRYISPLQRRRVHYDTVRIFDVDRSFDTINHRFVPQSAPSYPSARVYYTIPRWWSLQPLRLALSVWWRRWRMDISPVRAWNLSLAGATVFGMIVMAMVYRSFGMPVFATDPAARGVHEGEFSRTATRVAAERAVTAHAAKLSRAHAISQATIVRDPEEEAFQERARTMVSGYPIEKMLPYIFQQDRTVAAYLIAIAKQESQWGKRVPVLNGKDCYNYWGFRAKRARMGTGGHTCFDSPQDAVETVGRRLHELVYDYRRDTAEKLLIWKCGRSCATHDPQGVARWVAVVDRYYREVRALSEATDSPAVATVVH